jgi:hypothetical protein
MLAFVLVLRLTALVLTVNACFLPGIAIQSVAGSQ